MTMFKFITAVLSLTLTSICSAQITYEAGAGSEKGKHLVFIASDHEYRAEQTCPALARILAQHHGFKCTVLFGVDKDGFIEAGASNIKGLEVLKDADGVVLFGRFLDLPDEQMQHIVAYLDRAGPIVGLRTSSHAFKIPKGKTYSKYDFKYAGSDFKGGFGQQVLGNTWEGHYGRNHKQGTRIQILPEQKKHPILKGVDDGAFCYAGAYNSVVRPGMKVLTNSQPMLSMKKDAKLDDSKPPMASTWTFSYKGKNGKSARAFHSTQGASQDILDENYRRMLINGIYWSVGLEAQIKQTSVIDFVGPYRPTTFRMNGHVKNLKPEGLAPFDSVIGE